MKSEPRLPKSRFTSGLQCHKQLWWKVHEPDAVELQPDKVLRDPLTRGARWDKPRARVTRAAS